MDPALILGPYGAIVLLVFAVKHLYQENRELREDAMDLLKKYQDRDEEERKLRIQEEKTRLDDQWRREHRP